MKVCANGRSAVARRKQRRRVASAFITTAFAQDDAEAACAQWRPIADQLRPKLPKLAVFLDEAETDVLAYMSFPAAHWDMTSLGLINMLSIAIAVVVSGRVGGFYWRAREPVASLISGTVVEVFNGIGATQEEAAVAKALTASKR